MPAKPELVGSLADAEVFPTPAKAEEASYRLPGSRVIRKSKPGGWLVGIRKRGFWLWLPA